MKKHHISMLLIACGLFFCSIQTTGTTDETSSGIALYKPDGSPAVGALVQFYAVGDTSKQFVYQTQTDENGNYSIEGVTSSSGSFNVWAQLGDSLVAIQDSVYITATSNYVKDDTLDKPGSITGIVGIQPNHDPRTVTVQAVGTHLYSNVDEYGRFTIAGMAQGKYTLRLASTIAEYTPTYYPVNALSDSSMILSDTLRLIYTGIPVVTGISSSYDTLNGIITLTWNRTTYNNFQDYLVYRDHADSINLSDLPIGSSVDSTYHDTIQFPNLSSQSFKYRIKIRNNSQIIGNSYKLETVTAVHPAYVQTIFSSTVINKTTGLSVDTLSTADTALIVINFQNPTRPYTKISWAFNYPDSIIHEKALDSFSTSASDSIILPLSVEGNYYVFIFLEDLAGTLWKDTILAHVWDYPEPVQLWVDSIIAYFAYLRWNSSTNNKFYSYAIYWGLDSLELNIPCDYTYSKFDTTYKIENLPSDTSCVFFKIGVIDSNNLISCSRIIQDSTITLWAEKSTMNTARDWFSSSVVSGKIYVFGGKNFVSQSGLWFFSNLNSVEEYDPEIDLWTEKASMPTGRSLHSSCVFNDKIYVIGGVRHDSINGTATIAEFLNSVEEYDPLFDSWTIKTPMPTPRGLLTTFTLNNKIYCIGGNTGSWKTTVEEYDPTLDSWIEKNPLPFSGRLSSCTENDKCYVIKSENDLLEIYEYNQELDSWHIITSTTINNSLNTSSICNSKIYNIGYDISPYSPRRYVRIFNTLDGTWFQAYNYFDMQKVGTSTVSSCIGNKIYLIGGDRDCSGMEARKTVWEYRIVN